MKNIRDFFLLFFFFSLMTYFVMFFKRQENMVQMEDYHILSAFEHSEKYMVICSSDGVTYRLPMEQYLVGALAASIPAEYEPEVLKAQAILLRSSLYGKYEKTTGSEKGKIIELKENEFFRSDRQMQQAWKEQYETNLLKCVEAVTLTQGMYLASDGKAIEGFFHAMSAGKTRDESGLSGEEGYRYLKVAECPENLGAQNYETTQIILQSDVGKLGESQADSGGYILSLKEDGETVMGEDLRSRLGLRSSNYTWETKGENYIFKVKGSGHGFGMDQYYADQLAKKGMNYREILDYFFEEIDYCRVE